MFCLSNYYLHMFVLQPSKVASLIVVDTSPVSTSGSMDVKYPKIVDAMSKINIKGMSLKRAREFAENKMLELDLFHSQHELQNVLLNIGKLSDKSIGWKYNLKTLKKSIADINSFPDMSGKTYRGPTLFVAGRLSYAIP